MLFLIKYRSSPPTFLQAGSPGRTSYFVLRWIYLIKKNTVQHVLRAYPKHVSNLNICGPKAEARSPKAGASF